MFEMWSEPWTANQKKKKKRKFQGDQGHPHPRKLLKVETNICKIWGILEANLKKCSTLKFMTNISFLPSVCIHRSIHHLHFQNFIDKKYVCRFFPMENIFFCDFQFSFPRESSFLQPVPGPGDYSRCAIKRYLSLAFFKMTPIFLLLGVIWPPVACKQNGILQTPPPNPVNTHTHTQRKEKEKGVPGWKWACCEVESIFHRVDKLRFWSKRSSSLWKENFRYLKLTHINN